MARLAVVTATLDLARATECIASWYTHAAYHPALSIYVVMQGEQAFIRGSHPSIVLLQEPEILGVVPAFAKGVQVALDSGAEVIACFHDDLLIEEPDWAGQIAVMFERTPIGLAGFGGATGLGDDDLYRTPYHPTQLARKDFVSNMRHAEAHGRRWPLATRVACLDGFSQIGRREFWEGRYRDPGVHSSFDELEQRAWGRAPNLFAQMARWGVVHHFYDGMLGCFAARLGWETWLLPIACHHYGGRTAAGDPRYAAWARLQKTGVTEGECGDAGFWMQAHQIGYEQFRDVLPLRVP